MDKKNRYFLALFFLQWIFLSLGVLLSFFLVNNFLIVGLLCGLLAFLFSFILLKISNYFKKGQISEELLNLGHLGNPLLTMLSKQAPGTYNHSLAVAQLSVACGRSISLDSEYLRLGSYYHDIGKLKSPKVFIENSSQKDQGDSKNLEKQIIAHVKNGLNIAKEYSLPREITDIIAQHHGDSSVESFKASKIRYPGPKPQNKLSGIIMISDCIEASLRSKKNSDYVAIEKIVTTEIEKKEASGQLKECGLTKIDLSKIKIALIETSQNIHHKRTR